MSDFCEMAPLQTAMDLAQRLEDHPRIARVHYPGLPSHSDHRIAKAQMPGGFGGVISFEVILLQSDCLCTMSDLHEQVLYWRCMRCALCPAARNALEARDRPSVQVDADLWGTAKFVDSVRLPYIAPSLGGVDSLIEQPTVISYWDQVHFPAISDHACKML